MECWWCLGQSGVLVVPRTEWSAGGVQDRVECWWCLGQSGVLVVPRTEWSAGGA